MTMTLEPPAVAGASARRSETEAYDPIHNDAVEHWLRTTVAETYDRVAAGQGHFSSGDEVREWLAARRTKAT